ncbi:MAG TPA: hypothetical protein PK156_45065 [Polyangium sp.]|nr:hypothetical protein [Polyangium sp.]
MLMPGETDDPEAVQDADTCLRRISRLFLHGLTELVVRPGESILDVDWGENQVSRPRQRRLDRIVNVDVSPEHRRVLHIEWAIRLDAVAVEQTADCHIQAAIVARQDARRTRCVDEPEKRITVTSIVVVLTGRKTPWPEVGELRTSDDSHRFTGVEFYIEPVYQRTIEQLEAKGHMFWLSFVPLACDADEQGVRRSIQGLRIRANEEEFGEIVAAMLSMAQLRKKDWPGLPSVIRSALRKEGAVRHPWFCDGKKVGLKEGLKEGLARGREEGREEGLRLLTLMIERRLGRRLRAAERRWVGVLVSRDGLEKLGAAVIDVSPQELEAYVTPQKIPKTPRRTPGPQGVGAA